MLFLFYSEIRGLELLKMTCSAVLTQIQRMTDGQTELL